MGKERAVAVALASAVTAVAAAVSALLARWLPVPSLALVFVVGVLAVAVRSPRWVALYCATVSFLAYNFFFTQPRYTLRVTRPEDLVALLAFLVAAVVCSQLAAQLRSRAEQQVAMAREHARLTSDLERTRLAEESERMRAALLSSVSHDLRSPLAAVIGAASSLVAYGEQLSAVDRQELLLSIQSESERLDRYIQNLLDMTRLGSGGLKLQRDWVAIDELLGSALTRMRKFFPGVPMESRVGDDLPLLYVHPALIEQAMFNILENAAKFSPAGASIVAAISRAGDGIVIEISDQGPGIPEEERRRIFDLFYSADRGDQGRRGSGLGLTIVRGMVGAHAGKVEALPGPGGAGTTIRVTLPIPESPDGDGDGDDEAE